MQYHPTPCGTLGVLSGQQLTRLDLLMRLQDCSAGDSAAYQRRNSTLDDVVIVAALRTPLTKVSSSSKKLQRSRRCMQTSGSHTVHAPRSAAHQGLLQRLPLSSV